MKIKYFKNKKNILTMCLFFLVFIASGQQRQINGSVLADDGQPLPGANIIVENSNNGTTTDLDGKFKLSVDEGATLLVSYIGYVDAKIKVTSKLTYGIKLQSSSNTLSEVIVIGYSKEKKSDIAGAISVVKMADIAQETSPNILSNLQGRVAGLQINSGGTPGGNDTQILIRGLTTVTSGSAPLWVIDGVQTTSSSSLNPEEIESIQVLKDGASAAIYGTSAANGVIVVTTKKGKNGVSEFTFKSETTVNMLRDKISLLNSQQWADVEYQAQLGAGIATPTHPVLINNGSGFTIPQYLDPNGLQTAANTNWVNEITNNTFSSNTDFGYRKGTENLSLYTQLSYSEDNGIQRYTSYDRFNARINASYKLFKDRLTIGENFLYSKFNEVKANEFENAILQNPMLPVYSNLGDYATIITGGMQDKPNSVANLWSNRKNEQKYQRFLGNAYLDFKIIEGLVFNTTLNFDKGTYRFNTATQAFSANGVIPSVFNNITTDDVDNDYLATIFTNTLKYDKTFGKHRLSLLGGIENAAREENFHNNQINGVDITDPSGYVINANAQYKTLVGKVETFKISQFGSVKYVFDERYILSGTVRRDGSSRFGENNKYGIFPSASLAWNAKNEKFLTNNKYVSNFKLRASWGVNGNDQIADYAYLSSFVDNTVGNVVEFSDYNIDGTGIGTASGVLQSRQANPDLKWESTEQYNVGFDLGFFNERLSLQTDFYIKTTNDLILRPIALSINGESQPPLINAGSVSNKGFEAVLSYKSNPAKDFKYGVDLNFSTYENNVESLDTDSNFLLNGVSITRKGSPIASFYGLIADGLFRTPEEVAVHANQPGKALGRIRYRDVNLDGKIDQFDRTIIGNPHPDFIYGINLNSSYKGFDLTLFFDGKQGNDLYNAQRAIGDFDYFSFNHGTNTLDAWTPSKANSNIPALSTLNSNNELQPSSYYVEDGSYIRLKTITVGYNFDNALSEKLGMNKLRLYVVGQNLFTLTSFTGFDYEVSGLSAGGIGVAGYGIPHSKSITFGINANF
ncbi:TonB-linked outer membrane protein, SusC/RagA family [Flavobacterium fluvii]|uniref:TonB-linked outer membrane protein, SusC/RagA family n=1 Tax=Flavobacterium fluvii TaxID=468056 RepID=A0A1M5FIW0_9FLAO|nr:TonB-dependent receptor [Flavobacterium fluvii]SHF91453.1 TonB-linked outer membrane protein, SusC/RagA family [Flavobacterium fluvii]